MQTHHRHCRPPTCRTLSERKASPRIQLNCCNPYAIPPTIGRKASEAKMYCPTCGTQNTDEVEIRFCRSCGADLRAVSRAVNRSLPVRLAASLDSYFENRFQQNLRNGVLNLLAFVFLLVVGTGYLVSGWTGFGVFMLVLSVISIVTGVWDIWIYRRNLP